MANTKGKKMEETKEVVVGEVKDIDFGDLELRIAKPTLNKDNTVVVSGNFTELGTNIKAVVNRYKDVQLTEDNVEYVKTLKKQFVSLRTGIEREKKEYKKVYIDPAENLLKAMCDELLQIVDEGERALGDQLDAYDQRRKDELTLVLTDYVNDAKEKFGLRDEYATQIQLKKEYYNKTQKEEDSIDDINAQAEELSKKQKEHDAGVAMITEECNSSGLLPDAYIRELQYKSAMEILMEIKQDIKSRAEMKAKEEGGEKVTIGADVDSEIAKQMAKATALDKVEKKTKVLRITYTPTQAKLLAEFFKKNSIEFEFINQDF